MIVENKTWKDIKDKVYGEKGSHCRDDLDRDFDGFKIAWLIKKAREENQLMQSELAELIDNVREYISKIEKQRRQFDVKNALRHVLEGPTKTFSGRFG